MVPYLCNYDGWAVFMDCDMLCLGDIAEIAGYMTLRSRWSQAVQVVKHSYSPKEDVKFLGERQTSYERKNWSSMMVFNNPLCRTLTPEYVHSSPGLALHQFRWTSDDKIGSIPRNWNYLVGEENQSAPAKLVHFTKGGPYFESYANCEYSKEWWDEFKDMTHAAVQT